MSEDERLKLLETIGEVHARLADAALALRRRPLPAVRQGSKIVDLSRLWQGKDRGEMT